jgi:hypothetical protein
MFIDLKGLSSSHSHLMISIFWLARLPLLPTSAAAEWKPIGSADAVSGASSGTRSVVGSSLLPNSGIWSVL